MKSLILMTVMLSLTFSIVGCKKFTKEIANAEKPSDAPEYTVEYDANRSPAEGGSRKPTS